MRRFSSGLGRTERGLTAREGRDSAATGGCGSAGELLQILLRLLLHEHLDEVTHARIFQLVVGPGDGIPDRGFRQRGKPRLQSNDDLIDRLFRGGGLVFDVDLPGAAMRSRYMAEGVFVAEFRGSRTGVNQTTSARPTAAR